MGKAASSKKIVGKPAAAKVPASKASAQKGSPAKGAAKPAASKVPPARTVVAKATTASRNGHAGASGKVAAKPTPAKPAASSKVVAAAKPVAKSAVPPVAAKSSKPAVAAAPVAAKGKPAVPSPAVAAKPAAAATVSKSKPTTPPAEPRRDARAVRAQKPSRYESADRVVRPSTPALPPVETANSSADHKPKKNQAGLSNKELDGFRDMLLAKRRELVGDMSSMEKEALSASEGNLSSLPIHMADMGTDNYEQEFTLGLVEKDRNLLREINYALAKIQAGTYGLCEGTGKPIAKVRLEAQPWARFSIEYARTQEKGRMMR